MAEPMDVAFPPYLDELERILDALPGDPMSVSQLDGFLTGILVSPTLILPSEWLKLVWGAEEDGDAVFETECDVQRALELVMQHYNTIAAALQQGRGKFAAWFDVDTRNDETLWEIWMEGFAHAMALRADAWVLAPNLDRATRAALSGLLELHRIANRESRLPKDEIDELTRLAPDLIPAWVEDLHVWRITGHAGGSVRPAPRTSSKIGRNEPCPCRSGKKYKKCCGLN